MRARAVTRELLARYARKDAGSLRFRSALAGKPVPIDGGSATGGRALHFSVSHSGEHALLAVGLAVAVGVDAEDGARTRDYRRVAQRARTQGVLIGDRLDQPPGDGERFLREWVRAEAELKCLGRGLKSARGAARERQALWCASLGELPGVPRAAAAIAARRPPRELRCWASAPHPC